MPKISVVIPAYNRAMYVIKAIDSVLAQIYGDYEIIVVDDGSTDDTREVLKPYMGKVSYIYQANSGASAARNAGIRAARGEWVAFLDSDDEWLPEKLAIQMDCIAKNPRIEAHVTNATIMLPDDKTIDLFTLRGRPDYGIVNSVLDRPFIDVMEFQFFTPTLLARRRTLTDIGGFDVNISIYEDGDIMRRLALEGPWGVSNKQLVLVFRRQEVMDINLSRQRKQMPIYSYECLIKTCNKLLSGKKLNPREKSLVLKSVSGARFDLGAAQFKAGFLQEGLASIKQSFRDNPSLKSLVRCAAVSLLGSAGLTLIQKTRSFVKKDFRRSDFVKEAKEV